LCSRSYFYRNDFNARFVRSLICSRAEYMPQEKQYKKQAKKTDALYEARSHLVLWGRNISH